jgi:hypothetical protein
MGENDEGVIHSISDGGVTGKHPPAEPFKILVAPARADEFNLVRLRIIPVACWRGEDIRFQVDSSFPLPDIAQELAALERLRRQHPQAQFLWDLRENVLRQTEWGRNFFARYWNHYYLISPPIAEEMKRDPELRDTVRWSILEPWTNYMKLLLARPDWDQVDFDAVPATVRDFLLPMRPNMDTWLENIPLPRQFGGRDPMDAVQELTVALTFVRRTGGLKYLHELRECGELPLGYDEERKPELLRLLREAAVPRGKWL